MRFLFLYLSCFKGLLLEDEAKEVLEREVRVEPVGLQCRGLMLCRFIAPALRYLF